MLSSDSLHSSISSSSSFFSSSHHPALPSTPPSSLSSAPPLLFVSPFPFGHKRRRHTSFPVAWSHTGVAHIHIYCALCIFCNVSANALIRINIHTTLRDKQLLCICAFVLSGHVSQQRKHMCHCLTNIYSAVCWHNSFKSICGQGVFYASSLSCIYMRLLFQMLVHILLELNSS